MPAMGHDTEPLLSAYHFNYTQRPRRDKAWALSYILLLLLTLGWALLSLVIRPDLIAVLSSPDYLDDPNHCPLSVTDSLAASPASWPQGLGPQQDAPGAARSAPGGFSTWATRAVAHAREAVFPAAARRGSTQDQLLVGEWRQPEQLAEQEVQGQGRRRRRLQQGATEPDDGSLTGAAAAGLSSHLSRSSSSTTNPATTYANTVDGGDSSVFQPGQLEPQGGVQRWDTARLAIPRLLGAHNKGKEPPIPGGGGGTGSEDGAFPRVLLDYGGLLLLISLGAAVVLALLFVLALRFRPWALVLLACGLQVGAPLASAVVASKAGNSTLTLILLLISAAVAVSLYCGRDGLVLVSRLLGLAAVALRDNPSLLGLVTVLKTALAGATALLMAAVAVVGAAGEVVPNPLRGGNPRCATPAGQPVTCCALAPAAGLPVYLPAAAVSLAWTLMLLFELKVFVVSGVVAQWYFSPAGHLSGRGYYGRYVAQAAHCGGAGEVGMLDGGGAGDGGSGGYSSSRALFASLGHALGPSFGSLCAASGILGATSYLRAVVNSVTARSRRHELLQYANGAGGTAAAAVTAGPCCCCCGLCGCLACLGALASGCCWCLTTFLEQLTKFATVQMAMSGLDFWRASQEAVVLMRRNFMDAYNMWWYLPMILHCGAAFFAAAWGYAAYWLARDCWAPFTHAAPLNAAAAATLGALAAAIAELVLSFVCSVLVNIADALFVCFVLDRDNGAVTWYDLHCVLASLPCCDAARAAAEGHFAAAAAAAAAPPSYYYVPPSASYGGPPPTVPAAQYVPYGYQVAPAPQLHPQLPGGGALGQPVGYGQHTQRPQYGSGYGGFWGWLRSPSGSGSGPYGMPVGGYRSDRPQYPPPAVLSPPYSDQRFTVQNTLAASGTGPPPQYFGSSLRPS